MILLFLFTPDAFSQKVASLEVNLTKPANGLDVPVSINLDEVSYLSDTLLALYEIMNKERRAIPFQIELGNPRKMTWIVTTGTGTGEKHIYELMREKPAQYTAVSASINDGALIIHSGGQKLLKYYFSTVYPLRN